LAQYSSIDADKNVKSKKPQFIQSKTPDIRKKKNKKTQIWKQKLSHESKMFNPKADK